MESTRARAASSGAAIAGRSILITGAASGIGRETALLMAEHGASLTLCDLDDSPLPEVLQEVERRGGRGQWVRCDVTDPQRVESAVACAARAFGSLDAAFNCAGISTTSAGAHAPLADIAPEGWKRVLEVNLTGVWNCMRFELAAMQRQGHGSIVNAASIAGLVALRHSGAYVAAKHAVVGVTRTAALEYASTGIRVNAVCPGFVDTPMLRSLQASRGTVLTTNVPAGRLAHPGEIAAAVVWLCSDASSFVNGAVLPVDGGYTAG
jgi:NAD(P)-dependent dehydrogenase (short-subunit alcohol dehydrogenase family)